MKTILKFDTGADGFKKMMIILAVVAVAVLILGIYFIIDLLSTNNIVHKELANIS